MANELKCPIHKSISKSTAVLASALALLSGSHALGQSSPIPAPRPTLNDPITGTPYKADSEMQAVLKAHAKLGVQPIESLSVEQARRQPTIADAVRAVLINEGRSPDAAALVTGITSLDRTIPGPAGALPVRIYTPKGRGPFPIIVYFHGGGWVLASKEVYDGGARGLAKASRAIVVSVDYRLAPEAKFPAAWDDALAAYQWVASNAASIDGSSVRLALAGESAGGNLAVATAVAALAAGLTPPRAVLAVYPVAQTGNLATDSYTDSATAKPLDKAMIAWFTDELLADPAEKSDPRLDLVHAHLNGLPPVTIINAQIDPLRSDGVLLERALRAAGVTVHRQEYAGVTHEFFGAGAVLGKAKDAQKLAGDDMQRLLWE